MNEAALAKKIKALPPGLTGTELTDRLGINYQAALRHAKLNGYQMADGREFSHIKTRTFKPEEADWTKSIAWNARNQGVSRQRVAIIHAKLGLPIVGTAGRPPKTPPPPNAQRTNLRTRRK